MDAKYKDICIPCEVCEQEPAKEVKGGVTPDGRRGIFFCCDKCRELIQDMRREPR